MECEFYYTSKISTALFQAASVSLKPADYPTAIPPPPQQCSA